MMILLSLTYNPTNSQTRCSRLLNRASTPASAGFTSARRTRAVAVAKGKTLRLSQLLMLVCALGAGNFTWASAETYIPENLTQVVLVRDYPVKVQTDDVQYDNVQYDKSRPPQDLIDEARTFIKHGLTQADAQSLGYARGLLSRWDGQANVPVEARLLRAVIAQQRHHFTEALDDLSLIIEAEPQHAQARATRAAIYLAIGNYAAAEADCRATAFIVDPLQTANCLAQINGATGHADEMIQRLESLLALTTDIEPTLKREVLTSLADLNLLRNEPTQAQRYYSAALAIAPDQPYVLAQLCDLLLQNDQIDQLLDLLAQRKSSLTTRLYQAIAEAKRASVGAPSEHRERASVLRAELRQELEQLDLSGDADTAKYWALFYLEIDLEIDLDAERALHFARLNWHTQKSLADARVLQRAAMLAQNNDEQRDLAAWLNERNIDDQTLLPLTSR